MRDKGDWKLRGLNGHSLGRGLDYGGQPEVFSALDNGQLVLGVG